MKKRRNLAQVTDPAGRLDVLLYQLVGRVVDRLEQEQGVTGLREHILPIVEDAIVQRVPGHNLIPREISALLRVCELNRGRIRE